MLQNAIKYTQQGFIKLRIIKLNDRDETYEISVEDSGIGIDQNKIHKITYLEELLNPMKKLM